MVKNLPAVQETRVGYLGVRKVPWRREWLPTPISLPREIHGWESLVCCSSWGHKVSRLSD